MPIQAHYGDGRSARRHPVTIFRARNGLQVVGAHIDARYGFDAIRLTEPFAHAPSLVWFNDGAHCEVEGAHYPALAAMLEQPPSRVVRWQRQWRIALGSIGILAAVTAAGYLWGVPLAAEAITALLPRSADVQIGAATRNALAAQGLTHPSSLTPAQRADILQAWASVQPAHPRMPLSLQIDAMSPRFGPNAIALPDGTVILNDAMARKILAGAARFDANGSAALAGVLAHEIGHVEGRHSMRSVVRGSLTAALSGFLFGDFSAVAAGAPVALLGARHSRAMEAQADFYAMATLQARHLPLTPLADLFQTMEKTDGGKDKGWFGTAVSYLSSHPLSKDRAALLRRAQ